MNTQLAESRSPHRRPPEEEARPPLRPGPVPAHPPHRPGPLCGAERLDRSPVLPLGPLVRTRRARAGREPAGRRRRLAAHRRPDEPQVPGPHRPHRAHSPRGDVSPDRLPADEPSAQEGLLLLALPGRHALGSSLEARPPLVRPQPGAAPLARRHSPQPEIHPAGLLRRGHRIHVRRWHSPAS